MLVNACTTERRRALAYRWKSEQKIRDRRAAAGTVKREHTARPDGGELLVQDHSQEIDSELERVVSVLNRNIVDQIEIRFAARLQSVRWIAHTDVIVDAHVWDAAGFGQLARQGSRNPESGIPIDGTIRILRIPVPIKMCSADSELINDGREIGRASCRERV